MTPFDIENLNKSIAGVGETFAANRAEKDKRLQLQMENDIRQRQLDVETRRMQGEQDRNNLASEGHVDQWLQANPDDDGNPGQYSHYIGPPSGLKKFMDSSAQNGTDFKAVQAPTTKPPIMVHAQHPDGTTVQVQIRDLKDLESLHTQLKKQGFDQPKQPPANYGPVAADKAAVTLEEQRDALLGQAGQLEQSKASGGPVGNDIDVHIGMLKAQADKLDQRVKFLRQPKTDPTQLQTVTTTEEEGLPGMPPKTKTVTSGKQRAGAGAPAATGQPTGKPIKDRQGKTWLYKGSMADPTQDKNPKNWVAQ